MEMATALELDLDPEACVELELARLGVYLCQMR